MVDGLLATVGLYGAALAIGFVAGLFPVVSIEVFLGGATAWDTDPGVLVALVPLAAIGHQIAKTGTYYAGAGAFALPRGKLRDQIAAAQQRIDRWNKRPRLIMFVSAITGVPPLLLLGFIARPLMRMTVATFTVISLTGRVLRYAAVVVVTGLF